MKLLRFGLRIWITLASVVSFLAGWVVLAHAQKPVQPGSPSNSIASVPTLAPLAPLNFSNNSVPTSIPLTIVEPAPTPDQSYYAPQPQVFSTGGS